MKQCLDLSSFLSEIEQGKVSAFTGDLRSVGFISALKCTEKVMRDQFYAASEQNKIRF